MSAVTLFVLPLAKQRKEVYGSPRVHSELHDRGHSCCVNTVGKLMQNAGIHAKTKKKFKATTDSKHDRPVAENLLNREFDSPSKPNEVWVSDITYLWTDEGWLGIGKHNDIAACRRRFAAID